MTSNYPFVAKLYTMLTDTENSAFISWNPEGSAFFVWNPTEFSSTVLPKYFKHNNFCSFVRQLNIYGFHKVENDNWMFTHDDKLFQRDSPDMISKIQRRRQQKRGSSAVSDEGIDEFAGQQSAMKKTKNEESIVAPLLSSSQQISQQVHITSVTQQQHQPQTGSSAHLPIHVPSAPHTPATPANHFSMPSPISSVSTSSTIDEDVAYLKNMNNVLLTELSQMKRKTQSQEDTISWLISELARTQRHVELMSQQQQQVQTPHRKQELSFSTDSPLPFIPPTPATSTPVTYTPQTSSNSSSTSTPQYSSTIPSNLSASSNMQTDYVDFNQLGQLEDYGMYSEDAVLM